MNIFDPNRIKSDFLKIKNLKFKVPITIIKPLKLNNDSKIIIFMNGLNGDRAWLKYFNHPLFDNNILLSFDQKGQAYNQEKPSQFYRKLINYNLVVIDHISQNSEYKNKKIILIGESWGAICSFLMANKRPELFQGFLAWNMPGQLPTKNPKISSWDQFMLSTKTVFTYLTGIGTKSSIPFDERLTSNKILIRASRLNRNKLAENKTSIAIYWSFNPAWKIFIKNKITIPFVYVQSLEDIMMNEKRINKVRNFKNVVILEKGRHVLFLENNSMQLGDEIQKLLQNIK